MRRYVIVGMFAVVLFGTVSALSAGEKLYHLSKVPKFRVGDRAVAKDTDVSDVLVTTPDGKRILSKEKTTDDAQFIYEVTKVDKAGKIQAFRVSIISARAKFDILAPEKDSKKIAIGKIHFIARRKGLKFDADTTTVVSEKDKTLKASQIWLLKKHCCEEISFSGDREVDILLMPVRPVPVGHSWKLTREAMDKWTKASPKAKKMGGKALLAEFRFVSVTDGIALVEGNIVVEISLAGKKQKMSAKLTARIDTKSGLWLSDAGSVVMNVKMDRATMKMTGHGGNTVTFKPGKGKVSTLPKKLFKIGWKQPGKDTNNHIDKTKGFSLNVPAEYTARKVPPGKSTIAEFVDKIGLIIAVTEDGTDYPAEIDEIVRRFLASVRDDDSTPGYTVLKQEKVTLANGVPSDLITAKAYGGKIILLTVIAVDGKRVVSISAGVRADMKDRQSELKKAFKTLRIFEPDYKKAPPKTPAENDERDQK